MFLGSYMFNFKRLPLSSTCYDYQTVKKEWKTLLPISVINLVKLKNRFNTLTEYLTQLPDMTIKEAYINDSYFSFLCNECLVLCGIDPEDCDIGMLVTFLFPHYDEENNIKPYGLLFEINLPKTGSDGSGKPQPISEQLNDLMATLWLITDSFEQTLDIISTLSPDELNAILSKRDYLSKSDKDRFIIEQTRKAKDLVKSYSKKPLRLKEIEMDSYNGYPEC